MYGSTRMLPTEWVRKESEWGVLFTFPLKYRKYTQNNKWGRMASEGFNVLHPWFIYAFPALNRARLLGLVASVGSIVLHIGASRLELSTKMVNLQYHWIHVWVRCVVRVSSGAHPIDISYALMTYSRPRLSHLGWERISPRYIRYKEAWSPFHLVLSYLQVIPSQIQKIPVFTLLQSWLNILYVMLSQHRDETNFQTGVPAQRPHRSGMGWVRILCTISAFSDSNSLSDPTTLSQTGEGWSTL